jgi:hypothetical protein
MKKITYLWCYITQVSRLLFSGWGLAALVFIVVQPEVVAQNGSYDLSLGAPMSNTIQQKAGITPFAKGRRDTRSQYLYLASELTAKGAGAGTIASIAFNVTNLNGQSAALTNVNIYLSATSLNQLSDGAGAMPPANANTPNKSYASLHITETGWVTIPLDIPFAWNGTDNIIVEICKSNTSKVANNYSVQASQGAGYVTRSRFTYVDNLSYHVPGCTMTTYTNTGNNVGALTGATDRRTRPDLRVTFACDGNPVAGHAVIKTAGNSCFGDAIELAVEDADASSGLHYQWQVSTDNGVTFSDLPLETGSKLFTTQGVEKALYRRQTKCGGYSVDSEACAVEALNKWNGSAWSKGAAPGENQSAVIDGDFSCSDLDVCSVIMRSGVMTVQSGSTLRVGKSVSVNGGSLVLEDGASLLQESDVANTGHIIYKRNSQPLRRFDFTYWSSPVQAQQMLAFSPETLADKFMSFDAPSNSWAVENNTDSMTPGKGYIIRAPQSFAASGPGQIFEGVFTGIPNNGDIPVPTAGAGHWNLIGNPYPSAVDAEAFVSDPDNAAVLDGTLYFWTHNTSPDASVPGSAAYNYTANDYAMWNLTGGVGNSVSAESNGNNSAPNGIIAAGQSFMVKGKNAGGTALFKNSMRRGSGNGQFFRMAQPDRHRIWLQLSNAQAFKQALIGYLNGATTAVDAAYDGDAMDSATMGFYSLAGDHPLGIQGLPTPFDATTQVPMGFKTTASGEHQISLYRFDGLFENQDVFLEDKLTQTIHNLKSGVYTFTSDAGTFNDRFVVRYTDGTALGTNTRSFSQAIVYTQGSEVVINSAAAAIDSVDIFDLSGRLLYAKDNISNFTTAINRREWATQIVVLRMKLADGKTINKKIGF